MADEENTEQTEGEPTGFDLETVLAQAKEAGVNLITEQALQKRLAKEQRQREDIESRLAHLDAQYKEAAKKLSGYESENKTAEQKRLEEYAKLEAQREAYRRQAEEAQGLAESRAAKLRDYQLEQQLSGVLADKAENLRHSTLIARAELDGLSIGENGSLVYTDPVTQIDHTGEEALAKINAWWEKQPHLHRAAQGGPPNSNPKPGSNGVKARSWAEMTSEERLLNVHQTE